MFQELLGGDAAPMARMRRGLQSKKEQTGGDDALFVFGDRQCVDKVLYQGVAEE
jgi:hypothetical protein